MSSRVSNSIKNASTSLAVRFLTLIIGFFSRTFFIKYFGEVCLGLNGLFSTILSLLSLAELGIGEAITFYLYKPIAEHNNERVRILIRFYKIAYRIIGCIIIICGIGIIPMLDKLVNFDVDIPYNIYAVFLLYLFNTAITYLFFSYPQSILGANQKQYIISIVSIIFTVITFGIDIIVMVITKNFVLYLILRLLIQCVQNFTIFLIAKRRYPYISERSTDKIKSTEIKEMAKDVYGIFLIRISAKMFESTDNLFISRYLGTILVGYNSNYLMLYNASISVINSLIYSAGASVGDYNATHKKSDVINLFYKIDAMNFVFSFVFSMIIMLLANPFIALVWGKNFLFSAEIVALMSINFYIVSSLNTVFMFRQSLGIFRKNKYNQLIAAACNLILDFLLVKEFGILGLYLATAISEFTFAFYPFIISLFKFGFKINSKQYMCMVLGRMVFVAFVGVVSTITFKQIPYTIVGFLQLCFCTSLIIIIACFVIYCFDKNVRSVVRNGIVILRKGR